MEKTQFKKYLELKTSSIQGKGVFAAKNFKKGEKICIMEGKAVTIPKLKIMYPKKKTKILDPLQISNTNYLLLKKPYIYINHSCAPNSTIIKRNKLVAIKNIKIGEEITYDYSLTILENNKKNIEAWGSQYPESKMKCNCSSKICRKIIGDFTELPKAVKDKYVKNKLMQDLIIKYHQKIKNER